MASAASARANASLISRFIAVPRESRCPSGLRRTRRKCSARTNGPWLGAHPEPAPCTPALAEPPRTRPPCAQARCADEPGELWPSALAWPARGPPPKGGGRTRRKGRIRAPLGPSVHAEWWRSSRAPVSEVAQHAAHDGRDGEHGGVACPEREDSSEDGHHLLSSR